MKILTSNDDGVRAPGNKTLRDKLGEYFDVVTVAPDKERSSCGHGITLGEPVRLTRLDERTYACSGLPADCILIGLGHLLREERRPDLVVSGINLGANLGQDAYYSGTVAAAREAVFRGVPAIAASLVVKEMKDQLRFEEAAQFLADIIDKGVHRHIPKMSLLNINFPNIEREQVKGVRIVSAGVQNYSEEVIERKDIRGKSYYWIGGVYEGHDDIAESDCNAVSNGYIAVHLQNLNMNFPIEESCMSNLGQFFQESCLF